MYGAVSPSAADTKDKTLGGSIPSGRYNLCERGGERGSNDGIPTGCGKTRRETRERNARETLVRRGPMPTPGKMN
eukprot:57663-Pyramimonas_sp.AAC.1